MNLKSFFYGACEGLGFSLIFMVIEEREESSIFPGFTINKSPDDIQLFVVFEHFLT